jgi:hypothetical protein
MSREDAPGAAARRMAPAALAVWIAALLALLFPQVLWPEPFQNDSVLHYGILRAMVTAPERGQSVLDPWVGTWTMGFPVFHYYQNLPHLIVAAVWKLSLGGLSLVRAFQAVAWLAVATLPWTVYVGARWMGFGRFAAAAAGVLVLLTRTDYLHGLDLESYTWQGLGQFAQAVGGWLFPLALARTFVLLRDGRGLAGACWLMTLTFLAHLALGYMAFVAAGLFAVIAPRRAPRRLLRLGVLTAVFAVASSYLVVPLVRDYAFYNLSTLVPSWKYDSIGAPAVLRQLLSGAMFDFGRPPVLTALVLAGFAWAAARTALHALGRLRQPEAERFLLAALALFFLLYFGRPAWGRLLDFFPLGSGFHWSRCLFAVHLLGTTLAGIAAADLLARLGARGRAGTAAAALIGIALLLVPARERAEYLLRNADLLRRAQPMWEAERDDLERALALAAEDRMGRAYAGQGRPGGGSWGGEFQLAWCPVYSWFPQRGMDALGYLHHMWSLNADLQSGFSELDPEHYRAFGVRRMIAPADLRVGSFLEEVGRFGRFRVLEIDGPGFLELVDVPYRVEVPRRNLARVHRAWLRELAPRRLHPEVSLAEDGAPPGDLPRLDAYDVRFPAARTAPGPRGEVLRAERTGDDFAADVRADRACHLLFRMSFHPGWKATVDGSPAEIVHVLPSFQAVALPPGEHRVTFRWAPGRLKEILAGIGLLAMVAVTGASRTLRL